MIGTTVGHYRIDAELGRGGMGVVYRAFDTRLERNVAIKVLPKHLAGSDEARDRFVLEARTASALDHPSICTIHDIGEAEDGSTYIVMPFYDGVTIRRRLLDGPIEPAEVARIGAHIADGLAAAHEADIVHRDIKPANILLTRDGRVKILDFGVAKMGEGVALTREGSTLGTAHYMSPEQIRGEAATARSDLWSLGVVLFEMVCGRRPFRGDYDAAATYAIINEEAEEIPDEVPQPLAGVIASLLRKDPGERSTSAAEVRDALGPPSVSDTGKLEAPPPRTRRSLLPYSIAAVAVIVVIVAGIVLMSRSPAADAQVSDRLVVFPFDVEAGPELDYLARGMVSMLSPMIDGVGGIRAVDPKAILGLVDQREDLFIDPEEGRDIAAQLGSQRYVLGSLSRLGSRLQLDATLYDSDGTVRSTDLQIFSSEDELLAATNRLMVALLGPVIEAGDASLSDGLLKTTDSFPAMKAYVQAEEAYRAGRFREAQQLSDQAAEQDSTFAAALFLSGNARAQMVDMSYSRYHRAAARHAANAPPRLRELIAMRTSGLDGLGRIEAMKSMLTRYPDDIDALGYVADQTYHQGPRHGGSSSEAIPLFLDVLQYDPDNGEYLYHIAPLLYRERRFDALDSLYRNFPAETNLVQYGVVRTLRDIALADRDSTLSATLERFRGELRRGSFFFAGAAGIGFFLKEAHDIEGAQYIYSNVSEIITDFPGVAETDASIGFELGSYLLGIIRGQIGLRDADAGSLGHDDPSLATTARIAAALMPHVPVSDASIELLSERTRGEHGRDAMRRLLELAPAAAQYSGFEDDLGSYIRARLAERLGDIDAMRQELASIQGRANAEGAHRMTVNTHAEIQSRILRLEGRPQDALETLDRYTPSESNVEQLSSWWHDGCEVRFLRAQLLFEVGRFEEAVQWSRSVHEAFQAFAPVLLPATYRLEAEAYERLGDWELAVERYDRLLTLWEDADASVRPQVEEIRRRREQAVARLGGEPGT